MAKRTVLQSVIVQRDGKSFVPPVGQVFDFSDAEVADIERMNPNAVSTLATVDAEQAPAAGKKSDAKKAKDDL